MSLDNQFARMSTCQTRQIVTKIGGTFSALQLCFSSCCLFQLNDYYQWKTGSVTADATSIRAIWHLCDEVYLTVGVVGADLKTRVAQTLDRVGDVYLPALAQIMLFWVIANDCFSEIVGSYIENLTITVEVPTGRRKPFELATSTHKSSSSDSFPLYKIVPRLTNLKRAYWSVLDDRTKSFFVGLFPLLRKLDLFLLVFLPVSVFSGCASLEELHVWGAETDLNYLPANADKVKIRALEVGYGPDPSRKPIAPLFSPPHSPLDISHLRNLKLTDALLPVSDVDDILKLCSNNLQELDLFLALHAKNVRPLSFEKTPNLGLLHNLCFLILRSTIESHPLFTLEEHNDLLYVASTLKTLPFDNFHCKQLQLTLQIEFIDLHNFENIVTSLSGWSDLTALLEENGIYFESIKIMFRRAEYNEKLVLIPILLTAMEDIMDRNEGLKRLREKGMLLYEYF
ncbi:hypothetical protein CPB84DRAFT_1890644 [Gymnopilus junonius]|uniref:Uncharacterized protein n=1 Tax=Gymnopilus junonius TaxID=109634 RepID=A0A9P5N9X4_GYMJU|nr:hypothetical protein CPB84DRAFT_1890644 [Gymnopilus junonius]